MAIPVTSPSPSLVAAAGGIWPVVCAVVVALRFYARHRHSTTRGIDDWLTIPALILLCGQGAALIAGVALKSLAYPSPLPPTGTLITEFSSLESRTVRQIFYAVILLQIPCLTCIKFSFIFFYRRIFLKRVNSPVFNYITWIVGVILLLWAIAFFFSELFICRTRFVNIWESKSSIEESQTCLDIVLWDQAFTASDFILDLVIFLMPVRQVLRLELSKVQRLCVAGVFSLGALAVAASITRLVVFTQELQDDQVALADVDLIMTACLYWTTMESGLALLAACLPSVYGLFNSTRHKSSNINYSDDANTNQSNTWILKKLRSNSLPPDSPSVPKSQDIRITSEVIVENYS